MDVEQLITWLLDHPPAAVVVIVMLLLIGVVLVIVLLRALNDGRDIRIWGIGIGSRPEVETAERQEVAVIAQGLRGSSTATSAEVVSVEQTVPEAPSTLMNDTVHRTLGVHQAYEFYESVAAEYDGRNSPNLLRTHLGVVDQIKAAWRGTSTLNIADLGGGTGKLVATMFYDVPGVSWTNVDFSSAMIHQFIQNLDGTPLGKNYHVHIGDILRIHTLLPRASFDVVILSFVLTSMAELPSLDNIGRLLWPGATLIIADIAPNYTAEHPYYAIRKDREILALKMNPVDPLDLIERAEAAGLERVRLDWVYGGQAKYSFILVLRRPRVT